MGIMIDTSILIEYFRKVDKSKTKLFELAGEVEEFFISSVTEFEIYVGANHNQTTFWKSFLRHVTVVPFHSKAALEAVEIKKQLKRLRKTIDCADLFIGSTAIAENLPFYTLNLKHFKDIERLKLFQCYYDTNVN